MSSRIYQAELQNQTYPAILSSEEDDGPAAILEPISDEETLLPPTSSLDDTHSPSAVEVLAREQADRARTRQLTFLDGLAIVVSLQIGAGIFSAPAQVAQHVLSPGTAMLIWLLAGLLVWTGAASFIELGLIVPQNGGVQEYLRFCYGDFMGFLFTWTWITISKPASMAVISRVFAEHLCHLLLQSKTPPWLIKLVALLGIWAITGVNCAGTKTGVKVANGFLVLKLLTVVSVAAMGIVAGVLGYGDGVRHDVAGRGWFDSIESPDLQNLPLWEQIGNTVTAFFGALYCYSGWESIGFITGDLINPMRDLPRILRSALVIVTCSFLAINAALFVILPMGVVRSEYTPVVELGRKIFGVTGSSLTSLAVAASAMGTMNANVFATAILCVAASQRSYFPRIFANLHVSEGENESFFYKRMFSQRLGVVRRFILAVAEQTSNLRLKRNVPVYAMILNALITSPYIIIGTFNGLVTFIGISEYFFFLFCTVGIFVIRHRERTTDRVRQRYQTWSGNPVLFSMVSGFIVIRGMITDFAQPLAIAIVCVVGWLAYSLKSRKT